MVTRYDTTGERRDTTWAAELFDEEVLQRRSRWLVAWASLATLVAVATTAGLLQSEDSADADAAIGRAGTSTGVAVETHRVEREVPSPRWQSISDVEPKVWSELVFPRAGAPEAIGSHSAGCVRGAVALPADGRGYQAMRIARWRFFGHPVLIDYIRDLGRRVHLSGLGLVVVSDLGQPRGGPTMTDHRSHQNGLDVDIWYGFPPVALDRPLTVDERQELGAPVVVNRATLELTSQWEPEMAERIRLAADDPRVDRLFVHPMVKRELCRTAVGDRSWLQKVRPWWNHHDHIHVRLHCPKDSPDCVEQAPLRAGEGCGKQLDWWFHKMAKRSHPVSLPSAPAKAKPHRRSKQQPVARKFPTPPERCLDLLQ